MHCFSERSNCLKGVQGEREVRGVSFLSCPAADPAGCEQHIPRGVRKGRFPGSGKLLRHSQRAAKVGVRRPRGRMREGKEQTVVLLFAA